MGKSRALLSTKTLEALQKGDRILMTLPSEKKPGEGVRYSLVDAQKEVAPMAFAILKDRLVGEGDCLFQGAPSQTYRLKA